MNKIYRVAEFDCSWWRSLCCDLSKMGDLFRVRIFLVVRFNHVNKIFGWGENIVSAAQFIHAFKVLCKRTQHFWLTAPNIDMLRPFARSVACCWKLLHPSAHQCQHGRNKSSQQCWELLRPFANSLTPWTDSVVTSGRYYNWCLAIEQSGSLRWPVPIYMRVGYVFDSRFLEWKIQPISTIFCILNK